MPLFESTLVLLAIAVVLLEAARRLRVPYPAMLALAGGGVARQCVERAAAAAAHRRAGRRIARCRIGIAGNTRDPQGGGYIVIHHRAVPADVRYLDSGRTIVVVAHRRRGRGGGGGRAL